MRILPQSQADLIEAVVAEVDLPGITASLLEKDAHLTEALRVLFALKPDGMHLVLCGGTGLAKAYGLIERMSEDADIKMVFHASTLKLSKGQRRARLRDLRSSTEAALAALDFLQDETKARSLNDNHYQCSHWSYKYRYKHAATVLRPHLQLEFTARIPTLPTETRKIDALVNRLAGRPGEVIVVPTLAVAETEAEKVLSFLRRFAENRSGQIRQEWDKALVRHIYDVHCIHNHEAALLDDAASVFEQLVYSDVREFGKQFPDFQANPGAVLGNALTRCERDKQIRLEYASQLLPLIYGHHKPDFEVAFATFRLVASRLLATLRR